MGNCSAKPQVLDKPDARRRAAETARRQRQRRSSLGRWADFLTPQTSAIRDVVSEELPSAVNRGSQEVINLVEGPGYLEPGVWCAGLDVPVVKARATALEKAIDALLTPLLNSLVDLLNGRAAELGKGQLCFWHTVSLKEVALLLPTASKMHNGVALPSLSHAFGSMLTVVHALSQAATDAELPIPPEIFHVASLNRLLEIVGTIAGKHITEEPAEAGQKRWQDWEALQKTLSLEEEKLLVTLDAQSKTLLLWMHGAVAGRKNVEFQVRRESAYADAFQQTQASELLASVRGGCVIGAAFADAFGRAAGTAEAGSTGHGPRKEFFLLVGQGMLELPASGGTGFETERSSSGPQPLFLYNRWAARYWFNTKLRPSEDLKAQYAFAGWLLGQSLCNRATLGAAFPQLLFSKLLLGSNFKATLEVLQEFDVEAAAAVRGAATMKDADWKELLRSEGLDPQMKRRAYIRHAVHRLLIHDVSWQFAAFAQGFFTAIDFKDLLRWNLTAASLEDWASWTPHAQDLKVEELFRVVLDPQMLMTSPILGAAVLKVVNSWSYERRCQFLHFVTGASRPCLPQMELLRIAMPFVARRQEEWPRVLDMLPQAHTCENILELPDYWSALLSSDQIVRTLEDPSHPLDLDDELFKLLDRRLTTAVTLCSTYELAGPASAGLPDLPVTRPEKAAAAGSKIPTRPAATEIIADARSTAPARKRISSHPVDVSPTGPHNRGSSGDSKSAAQAPTRIPKALAEEAAAAKKARDQASGQKPGSKGAGRPKQLSESYSENKLVQSNQSDSPLAPADSIPALRR